MFRLISRQTVGNLDKSKDVEDVTVTVEDVTVEVGDVTVDSELGRGLQTGPMPSIDFQSVGHTGKSGSVGVGRGLQTGPMPAFVLQ